MLHVVNLDELNVWAKQQNAIITPIIDSNITGKSQVIGFKTPKDSIYCKFHIVKPIISKQLTAKLYKCLIDFTINNQDVVGHIDNIIDTIVINLPESLEQIVSKEILIFDNKIEVIKDYDFDKKQNELINNILNSYKELMILGYGLIIPELINNNHKKYLKNCMFTENEALNYVSKYKNRFTINKCKLQGYEQYFLLFCKNTNSYYKKDNDGR